MISKSKINYWIDVVTGLAFILSVVSGIVLLFVPSGGFQGGRNSSYGREVLLLGHSTWSGLHTWSSIIMAAGVFGHLILHWNWIVCMTRKYFGKRRGKDRNKEACATTV